MAQCPCFSYMLLVVFGGIRIWNSPKQHIVSHSFIGLRPDMNDMTRLRSTFGIPFSAGSEGTEDLVLPVAQLRDISVARRTGCPFHDVREMLREVGLRPTRQRLALGWLLFAKGDRHVTAEILHEEAIKARFPVSLATVYNTLHQFTEVNLLREVAVDGSKTYFDTNASDHHHFYLEGQNDLVDIPAAQVHLDMLPEPPEGYEIARVDVVVRLRRKKVS